MKFVATEEIAAPMDVVWRRVTDFDGFEARISARAGSVTRTPQGPVTPATTWVGQVEFNGKTRKANVSILSLDAPGHHLEMEAQTNGMAITVDVALVTVSATRTRMTVTTDAKARTLAARLILQSAKLGRQVLAKRYKTRIATFARNVETGAAA
ncbi:hypothetical protein JANAI62_07530 [Jannaschia pagri]|uniref:Carbon monoxide dehydrogenase subunit G n=1 Tax=Jannaschia pagri TaxID=2829797 RepID=A0ABQ4NI73_9RHOB|nr:MULTISPECIES: SRPBCC family protein [unclassified Jannaschia]GIT89762.1 hypothetical protein JANAI61_02200 [Jannaschia sp. AI_61]GIT94130.1 hypothetical protein JANAI62_07530 [Jannaschia sp. AI_62]